MKLKLGQRAPDFKVEDIYGNVYTLESLRGKNILLSFFRDATCPFCNLRVYELTRRYPALQKKGLVMLAFFSSPKDRIAHHVGKKQRPFPLIADPETSVYQLYNVRSSFAGLMASMVMRMPTMMRAMMLGFMPRMRGKIAQMPADFLISPDLKVKGIYYGKDAADHIPVKILETFAAKRYGAEPVSAEDEVPVEDEDEEMIVLG
jgi:peroxiredoxin Q/BCP